MSLAEAVLTIAEEMDKESRLVREVDIYRQLLDISLKSFAQQLRIAVRASGSDARIIPELLPETQHALMIGEAREEFRKAKDSVAGEETSATMMVEMEGGLGHDSLVAIDASMPVGAKTLIANQVYVLQADHKLHLLREESTGKHTG